LVLHRERLGTVGLDVDEVARYVEEAIRAALLHPGGAALIHGDAHPGNVFWDASTGVTFIDTPHSHFSMDMDGNPIGSPVRDVTNMAQRLGRFLRPVRSSEVEIADIQTTFIDAYARSGGPTLPDSARIAFNSRYAAHDVLDTLTALGRDDLEPKFEPKLRHQLIGDIRALRRALGWDT
jgi:hypothetical protein